MIIKNLNYKKEYDECGRLTSPYTLAFVYYPEGKILIKGWLSDIKKFIEKEYPKSLVRYEFYNKKRHAGYWVLTNTKCRIIKRSRKEPDNYKAKGDHWSFEIEREVITRFKNMPNVWSKAFDRIYDIIKLDSKPVAV